jgi:peptidoglycan/xylan/chitin deacetylase (PgdA/CDA1 family)
MFDDVSTGAVLGLDYMVTNNVPGTLYMVSDRIDQAGSLSAAQLATYYAAGFDVGNHTKSHTNLTTQNQAQQEAAFTDCKNALDALGLTRASSFVAYPFGASNATTLLAMAATGMTSGRAYGGSYYLAALDPPYLTSSMEPLPATTLATVQGWITGAQTMGANVALLFHEIVAAAPGSGQWLQADFEDLIDWLIAQSIPVKTITDAWAERYQ